MNENNDASLKESYKKALKGFSKNIPFITGVLLSLGLIKNYMTKEIIRKIFVGKILQDSFVGSIIGSISAGNPITSYIIGGELLDEGISLFAVTAFIVAWVTVGVVQFPAEAKMLGKKFSAIRNISSFVLSMVVALITVILYNLTVGI